MNNLQLKINQIQVNIQLKQLTTISCLLKRTNISNDYTSQKYQIHPQKSYSNQIFIFKNIPTFALCKQLQLQNTKVLSILDRQVFIFLPRYYKKQHVLEKLLSVQQLKLRGCQDNQSKIKLQIQRKTFSPIQKKKQKYNGQQMGILQTQSQKRQMLYQPKRLAPYIPNAYQISRKNYKQAQPILRQQPKNNYKRQTSSSKNSYKSKHQNNLSFTHNQQKPKSPSPRQKTPQPIKFQKVQKSKTNNNSFQQSFISNRSDNTSVNRIQQSKRTSLKRQEQIQPRSSIPKQTFYQTKSKQNMDINSSEQSKYKNLTQKLQKIHDKISINQKQSTKIKIIQEPNLFIDKTSEKIQIQKYNIKQLNQLIDLNKDYLSSGISGRTVTDKKNTQNNFVQIKQFKVKQIEKQQQLKKQTQNTTQQTIQKSLYLQNPTEQLFTNKTIPQQKHKIQKIKVIYRQIGINTETIDDNSKQTIKKLKQQINNLQTDKNQILQSYLKTKKQHQEQINQLKQQLRDKKNKMAEIINIVWNFNNQSLMSSIEKYMQQ